MTRARDIANLVDSNGDIVAGALDNVPAADLVNDTTPQLGGNLDAQSNQIVNAGNISNLSSNTIPLNIEKSGGTNWLAQFKNTSGTPYGVAIYETTSAATGYPLLAVNNHNGSTSYLRVDSISGVVTMPKQPAFSARHAGLTGVNVSSNTEIGSGFWSSSYLSDNTNSFNTSTGRYTVPVAGYYFFAYHARTDAFGGSYMYHTVMKNGSALVARNLSSFTYSYNTKSMSNVVYMAANDYVSVYTHAVGDSAINWDGDGFFSGFLIG